MSAVVAIAHFIEVFGAGFYQNPMWPTDRQIIPWGTFWLFFATMGSVAARQQALLAQGVALGRGLSGSDKDHKARDVLDELIALTQDPERAHG